MECKDVRTRYMAVLQVRFKVGWAGVKIKQTSEECKGCKAVEVKEEQRVRREMGTG